MSLTIGKALELVEKLKNSKDPNISAYAGSIQKLVANEIDRAKKDYRGTHDLSSVKITSGDLFDKAAFLRTAVGGARRRRRATSTSRKTVTRRKRAGVTKKRSTRSTRSVGGARTKRRVTTKTRRVYRRK